MEKLSNKQGFTLTVCFILCNCFAYLYGRDSGKDIWISYILASLLALFIWRALTTAIERHNFSSFFEMMDFSFGHLFGKFISFILLLYALLSATTTITIFGKFTQMTSLPKTPQILLPLLILLLAALSLKSGLRILSHGTTLLFYFAVLTFFSFIVFTFPQLNIKNITPIMGGNIFTILKSSLSIFTNQFGDVLILLCIYPHIKENKNRKKVFLSAVIIAAVSLCTLAFFSIATLGEAQLKRDVFPVFTLLSIRSISSYSRHMEILTSIAMTFFVFIRQVVNLYFASLAIAHIFKTDSHKRFLVFLSLTVSFLTLILYPDILTLTRRVESNLNLYILLPLQLALPLIGAYKKEK